MLFRGLELCTGGQRLHRYEDYVAALTARGENIELYEGYLEPFRHGMPPHGGFAIGLERWVARLVEADNIRSVTLFPRDIHRTSRRRATWDCSRRRECLPGPRYLTVQVSRQAAVTRTARDPEE